MKWQSLRPIQEQAIHKIFESDVDLVISARTASGKTEAAFLPILSHVYSSRKPSVQALYVGPLKSLINDQFRRLKTLCERADIAVHRWHGDVDSGRKHDLVKNPSGVLLITPESIESVLLNRTSRLGALFGHLEFVVIDEIHALIGIERGTHLRSLLFRLRDRIKKDFRIIGLSATLGNSFSHYEHWLRPDAERKVDLIESAADEKRILLKIHGFYSEPDDLTKSVEDESARLPSSLTRSVYEHFVGTKNLVFANSKSKVEELADSLNALCRADNRPEEFLVHHGSLSKESRELTEREMHGRRPRTTVCSSTLELGIDIGNVRAIGQLDPPWSVSSQIQRLGRSGRGDGEPQCMRIYVKADRLTAKSTLIDKLHLSLLKSIAITELMLERPSWVEPPHIDRFDLSTLAHQILSLLAETGGTNARNAFGLLCKNGAFRAITTSVFSRVLRCLGERELIEQMPDGDLILAPRGEQLVRHYSFYSAFTTGIEFSVVHGSVPIGTLPSEALPAVEDHLLLGGRRWRVLSIDNQRREIGVQPARGKKPPLFYGGRAELHPRVAQRMRNVLLERRPISYADDTANLLLTEARVSATQTRLSESDFISISPNRCYWFTWTGSEIQRTLVLICQSIGLKSIDRGVALEFEDNDIATVRAKLALLELNALEALQLARLLPIKYFRKLDEWLSVDLLEESLAADFLDIAGAAELICYAIQ